MAKQKQKTNQDPSQPWDISREDTLSNKVLKHMGEINININHKIPNNEPYHSLIIFRNVLWTVACLRACAASRVLLWIRNCAMVKTWETRSKRYSKNDMQHQSTCRSHPEDKTHDRTHSPQPVYRDRIEDWIWNYSPPWDLWTGTGSGTVSGTRGAHGSVTGPKTLRLFVVQELILIHQYSSSGPSWNSCF